MIKKYFLLPFVFFLFCEASAGKTVSALNIRIPVISQKNSPVIGETFTEKNWSSAARIIGGYIDETKIDDREIIYHIACNGERIFIAMQSEAPDEGLLTRVRPAEQDQIMAYRDDCIEFWICAGDETQAEPELYQIIVNSLGAIYDVKHTPRHKTQKADISWRVEWEINSVVTNNRWFFQSAIPLSAFNASEADLKKPWGFRIVRNYKRPNVQADWTPRSGAFDNVATMGKVFWDNNAGIVKQQHLIKEGSVHLAAEIYNSGKKPVTGEIKINSQSASNPPRSKTETLNINSGSSGITELTENQKSGNCLSSIQIFTSGINLFHRVFQWRIDANPQRWQIESTGASTVRLDFKYYPSYSKLKVRVNLELFGGRTSVTGIKLQLKNKNKNTILHTFILPKMSDNQSESLFDTGILPDGQYEIELLLEGVTLPERITREFTRKKFEWENNSLGISDEVIAPYTPLSVSGTSVHAVLRTHTHNEQGFWNKVVSQGKDILSAPVSLSAEINGKTEKLTAAKPLSFSKVSAAQVSGKSELNAGALKIDYTCVYDYDGMMKVHLVLKGDPQLSLNKLDLDIPVSEKTAMFLHACPDQIRQSFIGRVPEGSGIVWESKQANRTELLGTFLPYVWIGNEEQGIAFFADNDKDWLPDDIQSVILVRREKSQVILTIRFVTKPGKLLRDREIIFGLQATPTKPMMEHPANWRKTSLNPSIPFAYGVRIFGSAFYWGGENFYTYYPREKDYEYFSILKRSRTETVPEKEWLAWREKYDKKNPLYKKYIESHIPAAMRQVQSRPKAMIPYTNPRGAVVTQEEFKVFQDEWLKMDYTSRRWAEYDDGIIGYEVIPGKSYQDFILYHYKKMLDSSGFDAIYFDNTFILSSRETLIGGAFIGENGAIRPSCDLFLMRDLCKRAAVLSFQSRGFNLNVSHMTSCNIVPINTWFGCNLDWEWYYGEDDYQDRFSMDYTRTVSLGVQTGSIPLALGTTGVRVGPENQVKRDWVIRTLVGTTMVHEIRDWGMGFPLQLKIAELMNQSGYGEKTCKVFRYWEDNFPVGISGGETAALLLSNKGELLLIITDYGAGGKFTLKFNRSVSGMKPAGAFFNGETNEKIPGTPDALSVNLKKHDFIVIIWK